MNNNAVIKGVAVSVGILFFLYFFGDKLLVQNDSLIGQTASNFTDQLLEKSGVGSGTDSNPKIKSRLNGLVKYVDQKNGKGKKVGKNSTVSIKYAAYFQDGKQFSGTEGDNPAAFTLGRGEVIPGIDVGMQGMKEGGIRIMELAPEVAYGDKDYSGIPANSVLIFVIELVAVK